MEERYLYPGDNVHPIEIGDGYSDYRLSSIADSNDEYLARIRTRNGYAEVLFGALLGNKFHSFYRPLYDLPSLNDMPAYSDAMIRFFADGSDPAWISLYYDDEEVINLLKIRK